MVLLLFLKRQHFVTGNLNCKVFTARRYAVVEVPVIEVEGYSRPACNKLCAASHDALNRHRCNPQARPSTSFVDLPWRSLKSRVWGKVPEGSVLLFLDLSDFFYNFKVVQRKLPCQNQLHVVFIPHRHVTDGQTHDDSVYHVSTASRGKKRALWEYRYAAL